jgi:GlpG protein
MRLIGKLADRQQAENFVAFLMTEGIQAHLESEHEESEIWIKDEDAIAEATNELEAFKANPSSSKYVDSKSKARKIQEEQIQKQRRIAMNVVNMSDRMGRRKHPLTILIIIICALVAFFTDFGNEGSTETTAFRALAFNAVPPPDSLQILEQNNLNLDALPIRLASISRGEIWRLVTPIFLHHDPFHLIFNMYWLFFFGSQIENRYGTFWFGLLVIFAAAIPNFVECVVPSGIGGATPAISGEYLISGLGGMSGVNYGLFGFTWMKMIYDRSSGLYVSQFVIFLLIAWLLFCMTPIAGQTIGNVANWAHAIGLLVGIVAGYLPTIISRRPGGNRA